MQEVPYQEPTNIRRSRSQDSRHGNMAPGICAPLDYNIETEHIICISSFLILFNFHSPVLFYFFRYIFFLRHVLDFPYFSLPSVLLFIPALNKPCVISFCLPYCIYFFSSISQLHSLSFSFRTAFPPFSISISHFSFVCIPVFLSYCFFCFLVSSILERTGTITLNVIL